jgi:hypothetical protein
MTPSKTGSETNRKRALLPVMRTLESKRNKVGNYAKGLM